MDGARHRVHLAAGPEAWLRPGYSRSPGVPRNPLHNRLSGPVGLQAAGPVPGSDPRSAQRHRPQGCVLDSTGYEVFIQRVVGHRRFSLWEQQGPDPGPPGADMAILHHHLEHSRIAAASAGPMESPPPGGSKPAPDDPAVVELLALKPQGSTLLDVRVEPLHAGTRRSVRAVTVSAPMADSRFLLGNPIRFRFQTNRPCHVVLIDVGTTGETAVLWPNGWHPDTWIDEAGDHFLPALEHPEFDFTLSGRAGTERIVAIASLTPLRAGLAGARRGVPSPDDRRSRHLVNVLKRQPSGWALSSVRFRCDGRECGESSTRSESVSCGLTVPIEHSGTELPFATSSRREIERFENPAGSSIAFVRQELRQRNSSMPP